MTLFPADLAHTFIPRQIMGDGNCLFRCGSVAMFGDENSYNEMRIRTVIELYSYEKLYLTNSFLRQGLRPEIEADLPDLYAQYVEEYTPSDMERLFRYEYMLC